MKKNYQTIPNSWIKSKLGDVSKVVAGFGFPIKFQGKLSGKYPFAKVSDMNRGGNEKYISYAENYLDEEDLKIVKVKPYPKGSVIFPKVGAALLTNKRRILGAEALIDNNIMALIPNRVSSEFLYYWMVNFDVTQHIGNGALPSINQSYVEKIEILLPPKPEQERIAEILSVVDEDIEKTEEVIRETEKLKRGLIKNLVVVPYLNKKNGKLISEICEINPTQIDPTKSTELFRYIDIASIEAYKIIGVKEFVGKDAPSRARRLVKMNDVIISTVRPNLKAVSYIPKQYEDVLVSTGFCVLRCDPKNTDWQFVYQVCLSDEFSEYLVGKTTGSNYPAVNSSDIGDYKILLPDIDKQKEVSNILAAVDEKITINKQLKEKLITLKKGLMSDLLSGKVRTI